MVLQCDRIFALRAGMRRWAVAFFMFSRLLAPNDYPQDLLGISSFVTHILADIIRKESYLNLHIVQTDSKSAVTAPSASIGKILKGDVLTCMKSMFAGKLYLSPLFFLRKCTKPVVSRSHTEAPWTGNARFTHYQSLLSMRVFLSACNHSFDTVGKDPGSSLTKKQDSIKSEHWEFLVALLSPFSSVVRHSPAAILGAQLPSVEEQFI